MKDAINQQYSDLYAISAEFRLFVEKMDKISTKEIIAEYDLKKDIISYCSAL